MLVVQGTQPGGLRRRHIAGFVADAICEHKIVRFKLRRGMRMQAAFLVACPFRRAIFRRELNTGRKPVFLGMVVMLMVMIANGVDLMKSDKFVRMHGSRRQCPVIGEGNN